MLTPDLWYEKANLAGQAAGQGFEAGDLLAAASHAYFSLRAFLTVSLIELGQVPPANPGAWTHQELSELFRQHGPESQRQLMLALLDDLQQLRYLADYGDHRQLDKESVGAALRILAQVLRSRQIA